MSTEASNRVRKADEFARVHTEDGFTHPDLAANLGCTIDTARRVRRAVERQLEGTQFQLILDMRGKPDSPDGWVRIDPDNTHHDVRLYRLVDRA